MLRLLLIISLILPATSFAQNLDALTRIKDKVHAVTLDSGLKVIVYPRHAAPVFSAIVTVNVGGVDETPGSSGISHLLEHMAFKGTKTLGTKNYNQELKLLLRLEEIILASNDGNDLSEEQTKEIADLRKQLENVWDDSTTIDQMYLNLGGVGLNATTSSDTTNYFVSLPNNAFDAWCEIEADRFIDPVWRQFYKERDVVQEERRMRVVDNVGGFLWQKLVSAAFEIHPYQNPTIGYPQDLEHLTVTATDHFYNKFYRASNMLITIVGDLDPELTIKKVERCFKDLPGGAAPPKTHLIEPPLTGQKTVEVTFPAEPQMMFAYHKPNYPKDGDLALNLWLDLMMGTNSSPVINKLVLKNKIANDVSYFEGPGSAFPNLYIITASPKKPYSNQYLLDQIDQIFEQEIRKGVDPKKLDVFRRRWIVDFVSQLKSNMGLAHRLAHSETVHGDWEYFYKWLDTIQGYTPEEINNYVKQYIRKDNRIIAFLERQK